MPSRVVDVDTMCVSSVAATLLPVGGSAMTERLYNKQTGRIEWQKAVVATNAPCLTCAKLLRRCSLRSAPNTICPAWNNVSGQQRRIRLTNQGAREARQYCCTVVSCMCSTDDKSGRICEPCGETDSKPSLPSSVLQQQSWRPPGDSTCIIIMYDELAQAR